MKFDLIAKRTVTLTAKQIGVLTWLCVMQGKYPQNTYGFNPSAGNGPVARRLAELGLVRVNRITATHFRYSPTEAGLALFSTTQRPSDGSQVEPSTAGYVRPNNTPGQPQ